MTSHMPPTPSSPILCQMFRPCAYSLHLHVLVASFTPHTPIPTGLSTPLRSMLRFLSFLIHKDPFFFWLGLKVLHLFLSQLLPRSRSSSACVQISSSLVRLSLQLVPRGLSLLDQNPVSYKTCVISLHAVPGFHLAFACQPFLVSEMNSFLRTIACFEQYVPLRSLFFCEEDNEGERLPTLCFDLKRRRHASLLQSHQVCPGPVSSSSSSSS